MEDFYYYGDKCISCYCSKGYESFEIKNMHQYLSFENVGAFDYRTASVVYLFDIYRIVVSGRIIGTLSKRDSKELYTMIGDKEVPCYGFVAYGSYGFYGTVCIEVNRALYGKDRIYGNERLTF